VGDGGILVKTFDNLVFGDKLGELLSNKEMRIRMSSDGVRHIIHNFEIKKIANAYLNLYKEAVK
jgi:glycosyltransferase involved in cell wall biosynthesis